MAKQMRGAEDPEPGTTVETDVPVTEEPQYVVVEYVGEPPYYREFLTSHTIQASSADPEDKTEKLSFAGQGIEVPENLVWHKDTGWKVKVPADLTDLLEGLRAQPFLKVHD